MSTALVLVLVGLALVLGYVVGRVAALRDEVEHEALDALRRLHEAHEPPHEVEP